ncbi:MAG: S-methyl-5-thioribose-1-phosphate isomerase, partial [Oscillospiraceae bacterium]|nr:S-methyl-5-thioribose-1-phosphate isomerase [Oscillospiraceae bacterium]
MSLRSVTHIDNVRLSASGDAVIIIDQSLLPNETVYLTLSRPEELYDAIKQLRVRGAPAIGIFAAYAVYVLSLKDSALDFASFYENFAKNRDYLDSSRPTAVNLHKMLFRMDALVRGLAYRP